MKILELRFKNLNSLYGEWIIDFTSPEFVSNGIFALTGPTGAGKSTILDAICLALYGATPRLGKITKSGNEIMSRQTGECYAEVLFESQAGRFRCQWYQHRARKRPDGNLAEARHEISDALTKKPIETKKRDVAKVIEKKTGMDFERFTRSILLAQGGFDTFLKADPEQKSRILEQITGTDIYTAISKRVHERLREEQETLGLLQAETAGMPTLDEEQIAGIQQRLRERRKNEEDTAAKARETEKAIAWLKGIDVLRAEIRALDQEHTKLTSEHHEFIPQRKRLERSRKTADLEAPFATITSTRKQLDQDRKALSNGESKAPKAASAVQQKEKALEGAERATLSAKEVLKTSGSLIQQIRSMDLQSEDKQKAMAVAEKDCKQDAGQIASEQKRYDQEKKNLKAAEDRMKRVDVYLQSNACDKVLVGELAGIREQLSSLSATQKHGEEINKRLSKAKKRLAVAKKKLSAGSKKAADCRAELKSIQKKIETNTKNLQILLDGRLLREYRAEKDALFREMALLRTIEELESERSRLEDGKPCPLCGSTVHPYAMGNVPEIDETEKRVAAISELIDKAEGCEATAAKLTVQEKRIQQQVADADRLENDSAYEKKSSEKVVTDLNAEQNQHNDRVVEMTRTALSRLAPLGFTELSDANTASILQSLEKRLKSWQENIRSKETAEKEIIERNGELKRLEAIIETQRRSLEIKEKALEGQKEEYDELVSERRRLFGKKSPDEEASRLEKTVSDAEKTEKKHRIERDEAKQQHQSIMTNNAALKERIEMGGRELDHLETAFNASLKAAGFADEADFVACRLAPQEREQIEKLAKQLDDRMTDLKARIKDRRDRLTAETDKAVTATPMEELTQLNEEQNGALKQLRDDIAGLTHQLDADKAAKEKIKEKTNQIESQKKECARWEKLHLLIGSADGKKYRNFAQGLTFELMVSHANRQLRKMTDRYLLIRDEVQPLELNVIDNYQAAEIRSTRNLSGGESFIVSLSLALGLSKMASRKVRVDSLFLDEGFGTLDEEALETALETLAELHQDGKLIGVISHVSAMKERISAQINVLPVSGGKSMISGPGCLKVNN